MAFRLSPCRSRATDQSHSSFNDSDLPSARRSRHRNRCRQVPVTARSNSAWPPLVVSTASQLPHSVHLSPAAQDLRQFGPVK